MVDDFIINILSTKNRLKNWHLELLQSNQLLILKSKTTLLHPHVATFIDHFNTAKENVESIETLPWRLCEKYALFCDLDIVSVVASYDNKSEFLHLKRFLKYSNHIEKALIATDHEMRKSKVSLLTKLTKK